MFIVQKLLEGNDLIYEGITTTESTLLQQNQQEGKEMTWFTKGLRQAARSTISTLEKAKEGNDLIYEGITTESDIPSHLAPSKPRRKWPDLRRDYDAPSKPPRC